MFNPFLKEQFIALVAHHEGVDSGLGWEKVEEDAILGLSMRVGGTNKRSFAVYRLKRIVYHTISGRVSTFVIHRV